MAWNILLAYVVVTEVIFFAWIWSSWQSEDEFCGYLNQLNRSGVSPIRKFLFYFTISALMFVAAPFAVPIMLVCVVVCYRQAVAEHRELSRMFQELLLDPLHPLNMPEELGAHIEEHMPAATAMGFESLGDYWLKDAPYNSKGRVLLSADHLAFAEIAVTLDTYYCELVSFLEDGSMVGTGNVAAHQNMDHMEAKGWYANLIGEADMLQTIESHLKFAEDVSNRTNLRLRKISRENWKDYYQYHNQKYGQVRYELGETDTPPVKCEFPTEPTVKPTPEPAPVS